MKLIAVEPSKEMILQRPVDAHPARQACAEALPFADNAFSHAMTVLSMHHWQDRNTAFEQIKRVVTERFVAVTWNPEAEQYWLTKDYFSEIYEIDRSIFPKFDEIRCAFPGVRFYSLPIPADCVDGFTAAYWARPRAYLDEEVRNSMSTFSKINDVSQGLQRLRNDLDSGTWESKYGEIASRSSLDVGYTIVVWDA